MNKTPLFAPLLTRFFTVRLIKQQQVSQHTVSAYRDCFKLLLPFAEKKLGKAPCALLLENIDASLIEAFLDALEAERGISAKSRNHRLTVIRTFFRYITYELPDHLEQAQRVLAIPLKRCSSQQVNHLNQMEVDALLSVPDIAVWSGQRDHALILLAVETGLRVSELTGLMRRDVELHTGGHIHVTGKGRKERCTPLTKEVRSVLKAWMQMPTVNDSQILFPNRRGDRLSTDGVQYLLTKHGTIASKDCPSLLNKKLTPHVLRHTAAMALLKAGVETSVIAIWLGHESVETTQVYLDADMEMKRKALEKMTPHNTQLARYSPEDSLLTFLKSL